MAFALIEVEQVGDEQLCYTLTVGRVQAFPGAPNVIPGKVIFTLEIRDLDQKRWPRIGFLKRPSAIAASADATSIAIDSSKSGAPMKASRDLPAAIGSSGAARMTSRITTMGCRFWSGTNGTIV
jgi:hypothetical protein